MMHEIEYEVHKRSYCSWSVWWLGYELDGWGAIPSRSRDFFSLPPHLDCLTQLPIQWVWGLFPYG